MDKFITRKRAIILGVTVVVGAFTGMICMRLVGNLLLGGTLFGGDWLWQ